MATSQRIDRPQYVAASIPYRVPFKLAALVHCGQSLVGFGKSVLRGELVLELNPKRFFGSSFALLSLRTAFYALVSIATGCCR